MWLEMKVKGLALDPLSNMPMIILRDEEEKRSLPIWVGLFEANAIALELEKVTTARPMTHDLIKNILESLDARVQKVVVNDLRENTFYAVLYLRLGNADITVDSRPSDAIALALRVGAPIFVEEEVVQKARTVEVAKETEIGTGKGDDQAKIKEWLESLKPGDFDRIERGKDPKNPDAVGRAISRANAGLAGNIIFGGGIGAIIDHNKGTAYTYPTWVQLVFGQTLVFDRSTEKDGQPVTGTQPQPVAAK